MVDKDNKFKTAEDRKAVVYQAVGAGSVCWENPGGAGIFDSEQAVVVSEHALARLRELDEPLLGLATTKQLIEELQARLETTQHIPGATTREIKEADAAAQATAIMLTALPTSVLIYRTVDGD